MSVPVICYLIKILLAVWEWEWKGMGINHWEWDWKTSLFISTWPQHPRYIPHMHWSFSGLTLASTWHHDITWWHDINLVTASGRRPLQSAADRKSSHVHITLLVKKACVNCPALPLVHRHGTIYCLTYDRTSAKNNSNHNWKHFCLGGNWPWHLVTFCL